MWDSLLSFLFVEEKEIKKIDLFFGFSFVVCLFCFFITSRVLSVVLNGQYCT